MKKKILLSLVLISLGMFLLTSSAFALNMSVLEGQNLRFQFQNWDVGTLYGAPATFLNGNGYGDGKTDSFALVSVTNINTGSLADVLWSSSANDGLTGVVYG